ncbi:MAG TPA: GntR family transcriptional regulator, partial [Longimicrobiales bacterium]|nr:GntR family transcriptional regulator [Longimicrobiales bacterium]
LRDIVLDQILSGELEPGSNIKEQETDDELGVSRTPLREALLQLKADKLVGSHPRRGFYVAPLVYEEAHELYEAIGLIESAALELSGTPDAEVLDQLEEISDQRWEARDDPRRNFDLDALWHETLLAHSPNSLLHEILEQLKIRFLRYELTYMYKPERIEVAIRDHREIVAALAANDVAEAGEILRRHWTRAASLLAPELDTDDVEAYAEGSG